MAMVRMEVGPVVVGTASVSSLVVLDRQGAAEDDPVHLPIKIGMYEASAIGMGVNERKGSRPLTHDLIAHVVSALGGKVASVAITDVKETTFYAQVNIIDRDGGHVSVDARPSDAIALAVRTGAPIYVSEDVLETAGAPDLDGAARDEQRLELERFHEFVNGLSPEDFNVSGRDGGESRGDSRQAR